MEKLYPLKFKPILKDRIWGGEKLNQVLGKKTRSLICGESWEISAVQGDISIVDNGFLKNNSLQDLIEVYMGDFVGDKVFEKYGIEFPILIKFIDANDDLSIQVHPNDQLARERHNSYGKTEMWYVMNAENDASLISGFNHNVKKEEYLGHLNDNSLIDIVNRYHVAPGDVFYIPAGRIHAIGAGVLLAEIQQTSDITYRLYDWGRLDQKGKSRELHTQLAIDAIDYNYYNDIKTNYSDIKNEVVNLVKCDYFTTGKIWFNRTIDRDYIDIDSFVIYMCCNGKFDIMYNDFEKLEVVKGETILLPASLKNVRLIPLAESEMLEIYI